MEGGRSLRSWKMDHPSAICFLYSVYMRKVELSLELGSSQLRGRKNLVLGRSYRLVNCFR